LPFLGVPNSA